MIKVTCEVAVAERDGKDLPTGTQQALTVASHWNKSDMVVLTIPGHGTVTVFGPDLARAVGNAMNHGRI